MSFVEDLFEKHPEFSKEHKAITKILIQATTVWLDMFMMDFIETTGGKRPAVMEDREKELIVPAAAVFSKRLMDNVPNDKLMKLLLGEDKDAKASL